MEDVKIKKDALALVIQDNREKHERQWLAAFEGYKSACIQALKTNLTNFVDGKSEIIVINELRPENHTKDYDRVLRMLKMSVDDVITLSEQDFERYVMDEWNWKQVWAVSNAKYLGSNR